LFVRNSLNGVEKLKNSEEALTAYCGLYCGDCIRFKTNAANLARDLLKELQDLNFDRYAEVKSNWVGKFKYYDQMCDVLNAIENIRCEIPCRLGGDGCSQPCEIKQCVKLKGFLGCWQCCEFETCDKFEFLKPFHGEAPRENLKAINQYGFSTWHKYRKKCYTWL
jgi:hypothetical protein